MPHMFLFEVESERPSPWPIPVALALSVGLHLALLDLATRPATGTAPSTSTILPALYLYAPDRRPTVPRDIGVPWLVTLGLPESPGERDLAFQAVGWVPAAEPAPATGTQLPGPKLPRLDSIFSSLNVDSEVTRYAGSAAPEYPEELLRTGVEGSVLAEFVVDTTGRVDLATVRIMESSDPRFQASVEAALTGMLFRAAWRQDHRVRQLVRQRFSFHVLRPPDATDTDL